MHCERSLDRRREAREDSVQHELEMGAIRLIGLGFIIVGSLGGLWLFFGNLRSIFPALAGENLSLMVGGGFASLVVVGILMMIAKSGSRGR